MLISLESTRKCAERENVRLDEKIFERENIRLNAMMSVIIITFCTANSNIIKNIIIK